MVGTVVLLLSVYMLLQGLFTVLLTVMYIIYAMSTGVISHDGPDNIRTMFYDPLPEEYKMSTFGVALFLSAVAMLLFIHVTRIYRLRMSIFTSIAPRPLLFSTALVLTSIPTLNILVSWLPLENLLENEFDGLSHNLIGAFTISVIAPLLEEVMFRGAIQGDMLRKVRNPWLAIIISALIFGIFHMNPVQIVYATLLGIVLGWIYYRTGSLMSVILGHVLNNTIATIFMLFITPAVEDGLLSEQISSGVAIASEIYSVLLFGALSVYFAVKLQRSLPVAPSPWHESDEQGAEQSSKQ